MRVLFNKRNYVFSGLIALILLASCKTQQQAINNEQVSERLRFAKVQRLVDSIETYSFDYNSLYLKFSSSYEENGKGQSFSGNIRIKQDSIIWVSITPAMGIEVARVVLKPDSLQFLNRINKTYYEGSYGQLNKMFDMDIDFYTMQAILTNEFFTYPYVDEKDKALKKYKLNADSNRFVFNSIKDKKVDRMIKKTQKKEEKLELANDKKKQRIQKRNAKRELDSQRFSDRKLAKSTSVKISILPSCFRISDMLISDMAQKRTLRIGYKNFSDIGGQMFPKKISLGLENDKNQLKLNLKINKVNVDKNLKYPFSISEKYKRIF